MSDASTGRVDRKHLTNDHGINDGLLPARVKDKSRGAERHASLWLEMKHAADHAQRRVGHEHN